jgi:hypothetical protein
MRCSLQASEEVIDFHAAEAYYNMGLTVVQYSVRRKCRDRNERVTIQIRPPYSKENIVIIMKQVLRVMKPT